MLLGLLTDVMSGGPLGFWALMALIARKRRRPGAAAHRRQDMKRLWLVWARLPCVVGWFGWLLASLYFFRWIDWWPIAFGALASIALFPVVLRGLLWIRRGQAQARAVAHPLREMVVKTRARRQSARDRAQAAPPLLAARAC